MTEVRLGLIGDNIADSQAPRLHRLAGELRGIAVRYDLLVPAEAGLGFDALFDRCAVGRYRGINVTHPYKERAAARVGIESPLVRAMGAVNLVRFDSDRARGFNTDYSGFLSAWRARFGTETPGVVCQVGAGGAGKAIGFALAELGRRRFGSWTPTAAGRGRSRSRSGRRIRRRTRWISRVWTKRPRERGVW